MNSMPATTLPTTWSQRLIGMAKAVWDTALRRLAQPTPAAPVAASQPVSFSVQTILPPKETEVVCLVVTGELNRRTFTKLIDLACAHYEQGRRGLLLDLSQTTQFELSGLFALLSIARLYSGQSPLDPETGWTSLHHAIEEITPALSERVKLIAPSPAVETARTANPFAQFLESHPDWESALAAFSPQQLDSCGSPGC